MWPLWARCAYRRKPPGAPTKSFAWAHRASRSNSALCAIAPLRESRFKAFHELPADLEAAAISHRLAPARPFRPRGGRGPCHAIDLVGRPARARAAARHGAGGAHAAGDALHPARRAHRRQGLHDPARGRRARGNGERRRQAALRRAQARRHSDHRAVPAAAPAAAAAHRLPRAEALPARGHDDDGLRVPGARAARLRAAGPAPILAARSR